MMADNKANSILDQDDAMESYFVGLLSTLDPEHEDELSANGVKLISTSSLAEDELPTDWEADVDEAERLEEEKAEAGRLKAEVARLKAEQAEAPLLKVEQAEAVRLEAEQAEAARLEAEQIEAARLEAEQAESARLKAEQAEVARLEAKQAEATRLEAEQAEVTRLEAELVTIDSSAPSWATHQFTALVGSVNNVNLTFPSSAIKGELEFSNDLKSVKDQPDWLLGLKVLGKDFIAVIDAGKLMLDQPVRDTHKKPYKKIILLNGSKWGIALDSISTEIDINASDIKWRKSASERPWLCGFISEHQLAIVDPTKIFAKNK